MTARETPTPPPARTIAPADRPAHDPCPAHDPGPLPAPLAEVWSAQQLTEMLSTLAGIDDADAALEAGVESITLALEADFCWVLEGDEVRTGIGLPAGAAHPPVHELVVVPGTLVADLPGIGRCATAATRTEGDAPLTLVVARLDEEHFSGSEQSLLRSMGRVLVLALRMLETLETERTLRASADALLEIQRIQAHGAPLTEVLEAVTVGVTRLLDGHFAAVWLLDLTDPSVQWMAASAGLDCAARPIVRALPADAGITGEAMSAGHVVRITDDAGCREGTPVFPDGSVAAAMAAPLRQGGRIVGALVTGTRRRRPQRRASQQLLEHFAHQTSLALTEAHSARELERAHHDPLTRLVTRARFTERLDDAVRATDADAGELSLLFVDLDGFKLVNDSLGHQAGDAVLAVVAERIRALVRQEDVVGRFGGDEFAVVLHGRGEQVAVEVAGRILRTVQEPIDIDGRRVHVSASVGVTVHEVAVTTSEDLLRRADFAMYRAKLDGRSRYAVYEAVLHEEMIGRISLESDLRRALDEGQLAVHYQPVVRLRDGRPVSVEALLRWNHPERGAVPPATFVPIAEQTGLIESIGRHVLRTACRQVARWRAEGTVAPSFSVSVNVSPRQLGSLSFREEVTSALADTGLPARNLVLELTESALVDDPDEVAARLAALKELGVRIAIDDFGTGYSALSHLRRFPADILKIDKVFIDDVAGGGQAQVLARSIVTMARALGLRTVAEGVEHTRQAVVLDRLGCALGQGYAWSRPMGAEDVGRWLRDAGSSEVTDQTLTGAVALA